MTLRSSAYGYVISYKFVKVKETNYGTSKGKAKAIKKNTSNNGIIVTDNKKAHWYKINNPKDQKLQLIVNSMKMNGGGSSGGLKITFIFPDGVSKNATLPVGYKNVTFTLANNKGNILARKGIYRVKIESYSGGNGYFTLTWK
jgi:hypothetical protein